MKKIFFSISGLIGLIMLATGCQKEISDRTSGLPALLANNEDTAAGNWRLVLMSRPDSFAVAAPVATTSPPRIGSS